MSEHYGDDSHSTVPGRTTFDTPSTSPDAGKDSSGSDRKLSVYPPKKRSYGPAADRAEQEGKA